MSGRRILAFRIAALVMIPALLLSGLEAGLRLSGYGYPVKTMLKRTINGKALYCPNTRFTWRFFPKRMAREFDSSLVFDLEKEPRTFRIFVLGGSAAKGFPEPVHNVGRLLEAMLSDQYPEIDFEVHNAAIVAINSHVVREIADDVADYDPDLVIVYLGNNEVVGPFGPGTILTSKPLALPLIRANIWVMGTRTGQLIESLLTRLRSGGKPAAKWEGMAMFQDKQVRADAPALEAVYDNYEQNLRDICRAANRAGVPVILSSVASNLKDCPPFASQHQPGLSSAQLARWEELYAQGVTAEEEGAYADAVDAYKAAAAIDDSFADLHFRWAECCWAQEDYEEAGAHYQRALLQDTLRFRADDRINQIVRTVADGREHEGIYFVDSVAALSEQSPHGIPGRDMFYEHVHMTFEGNYALARTLLPKVQKVLPAQAEASSHEILGAEDTAKRVAFTDFEQWAYLDQVLNSIMRKPPFTNQLYHDKRIRKEESRLAALKQQCDQEQCLKDYAAAIEQDPGDWRIWRSEYRFLSAEGMVTELKQEEAVLRKVIAQCPDHEALRGLGMNLFQQKRLAEAREVVDQLLTIRPNSSEAHALLGQIAHQKGHYADAVRHYRTAIQEDPSASIMPYGLIAQTYLAQGNTDGIRKVLRAAIKNLPESETPWAHFQLGTLLLREGNRTAARTHMDAALRLNPEYAHEQLFQMQYKALKNP